MSHDDATSRPAQIALNLELPPEFVESLADAIAERLELPRESRWLDVAEAADHLTTSEDAVRKAAQLRQLPVHQPYGADSRYLFDRDELDAWVRLNGRRG
jgi:excisionase family DNA binding protein